MPEDNPSKERDYVVEDYADRLVKAANNIHTAYNTLTQLMLPEPEMKATSLTIEMFGRGKLPNEKTIWFNAMHKGCKIVDVFNPLLHTTEEVIRMKCAGTPHVTGMLIIIIYYNTIPTISPTISDSRAR